MNILKYEYQKVCDIPSDINEHLFFLYTFAKTCNSVTEFGVRSGASTRAFLYANVKLRSYDLFIDSELDLLFNFAIMHGQNVKYIQADTRSLVIEPCDLLFIDTLHTYQQLKKELELHVDMVNRYIVFHDIQSYGTIGEDHGLGILPAILEFLRDHSNWKVKDIFTNNNGILVIEKIKELN